MAEQQNTQVTATLHWLDKSRSQRIVWLLQECKGLDWDIKVYKRQSNMLAPPTLKEIHPLGKSPVVSIETPNAPKPIVLAESGALTEYLCDYFAQHLIPKRYQDGKDGQIGGETEQWLRYRFYMHYAEGSLMTILLLAMIMDMIAEGPGTPFFIKPLTRTISARVYTMFLTENFKTHFSFLESQLATAPDGGQYLCGKDLTAADILMSFPVIRGRGKIDRAQYPKLFAYSEMLEAHEGYKASVQRVEDITGQPAKALL